MHKLTTFNNRQSLDKNLADQVAHKLQDAINKKGSASIAFSGGSTPKGFFNALSQKDIAWSQVTITLADDRWVDVDSADSNDRLIHENLLVNQAQNAQFFSLKQDGNFDQSYLTNLTEQAKLLLPLDVVILGMGEDGHTASIFPCSEQVKTGLDESADPALIKVVPTTAPYDRITFNYRALIEAKHLYLHIVGASKQIVLNKALADSNAEKMPIRAFLQHPKKSCAVFWAE